MYKRTGGNKRVVCRIEKTGQRFGEGREGEIDGERDGATLGGGGDGRTEKGGNIRGEESREGGRGRHGRTERHGGTFGGYSGEG